jgi:lipopolysaccharide biosynthesis regulator YciM
MKVILVLLNLVLIAIIIIQHKGWFVEDKSHTRDTALDKSNSLGKHYTKEIKNMQSEIGRLREEVNRIQKNQTNVIPKIQEYLKKLYAIVDELNKRLDCLEKQASLLKNKSSCREEKKGKIPQPTVEHTQLIIEKQEPEVIYLKNFRDGILSECKEAEAQFKITQKIDSMAMFCFCGDVATAIATKDATFADICELVNWNSRVQSITTIEEGQIKSYSEGKWSIVKPAKIKCE